MKKKRIASLLMSAIMLISIMLPQTVVSAADTAGVNLDWQINGTDTDVSRIGTDSHLLKLDNLNFGAKKVPTDGGVLKITYNADGQNSTRQYSVWTDLSGEAAAVSDYTFATPENRTAGLIVTSKDYAAGTAEILIDVPLNLLYDGKNTAKTIYVDLHIYNPDSHLPESQRGGGEKLEFDRFSSIALTGTPTAIKWAMTDSDVSRVGTDSHLIKLSNLNFGAGYVPQDGGVLNINYNESGQNSTRQYSVWTDLSGDAAAISDYTFSTPENRAAGLFVTSKDYAAGTATASVEIPQSLLFDGTKTASTIYVQLHIYNPDSHLPDAQRGGGEKLEFDRFANITLSDVVLDKATTWELNPDGANAERVGTDSHLIKFSKLGLTQADVPFLLESPSVTLDVIYGEGGQNSTRQYSVWTDLSGDAAAIADYTFATPENRTAGLFVTSKDYAAGTPEVNIEIPTELLYNGTKLATEIYLDLHIYNPDSHLPDSQRGGGEKNEFSRFDKVALTIAGLSEVVLVEDTYTNITLAPGADSTQMGFAWFTAKGTSSAAVVQIAKKADVSGKEMPAAAMSFTGVVAAGTSQSDTNKTTVTGLEKNTEYAYRVGNGETWSHIYDLTTYDETGKYNVIVVADPQISDEDDYITWHDTASKAVAQAESEGGAAFMMSAGDQANYGNDLAGMEDFLGAKELKNIPVMAAVGNHDNDLDPALEEQTTLLPKVYNWPNYDDLTAYTTDLARIAGGGDYYFSYGDVLYITLNSFADNRQAAIHETFMEKAIASNPDAKWRILLFHHDIYGVGDHAGVGYGDSKAMQATWGPFVDKYDIDIAFNGHDHIYARSMFMENNEIMKYQMPTVLDINENSIYNANAGTYVQPDGVQYIALGTAGTKYYNPEFQDWVAYTPGRMDVGEYTIMNVNGDEITITSYRADTDEKTDSITIKKTAKFADLQSLIPGCETLERGDITQATWDAFQAQITAAKTITETDTAEVIHKAYTDLYDSYYALKVPTDKAKLTTLIATVETKLETALEGRWSGQYPAGSKATLQAVLDSAIIVNELRLATQAATDKAYDDLDTAYKAFEASVSDIPVPWIFVNEIKAAGANTVDLVDWMVESEIYFWGNEPQERYDSNHIKQDFASSSPDAIRTEPLYGPANLAGGRGHNAAHITKTHIGEWIQYKLNVESAGMYKLALGAVNATAADQKVLVRDIDNHTLATFTVPTGSVLPASGWADAPMINADKEIYLPAGEYVIELFFVNDGVAVNTRDNNLYPDGVEVDILTFERTGDGTAPVYAADPDIFYLPDPNTAGGAAHRQQGWASEGYVDEWGMEATGIPLDVMMRATQLVVEMPAVPASTNIQVQLVTDFDNYYWNQTEGFNYDEIYKDGKLTFNLADLKGIENWRQTIEKCQIIISYYGNTSDELNMMNAYLVLGDVSAESATASDGIVTTTNPKTGNTVLPIISAIFASGTLMAITFKKKKK
ncbi:MAG: fibronectin type III domain-containing protein [Ruminococcus sp.]|nr:fibronectin type III domain-containing protein [Ruminococcus sp.]